MKLNIVDSSSKIFLSRLKKNKNKHSHLFNSYKYISNNNNLTTINNTYNNKTFEKYNKDFSSINKCKKKIICNEKNIKKRNIPDFKFEIIKSSNKIINIPEIEVSQKKINQAINNLKLGIIELEDGNFIINTSEIFELDFENENKINDVKSVKNILKIKDKTLKENKNNKSLKIINIPFHNEYNKGLNIKNNSNYYSIHISPKNEKEIKLIYSRQKNINFEKPKLRENNINEKDNLSSSHTNANTSSSALTNKTKKLYVKKDNYNIKYYTIGNSNRKISVSPKYANHKIFEKISLKNKKKKSPNNYNLIFKRNKPNIFNYPNSESKNKIYN